MQDYVLLKKENTRTGLLCLKSIFKSYSSDLHLSGEPDYLKLE